ncbi:peptidoglycan DD-metalloendopeptidase family protein [Nocardia sp. NPDC004860]|uniref:peptidoglycan DD-metalloendopeptidase family protein n=1 Tax=Nocardia sp. NPDC004860 TaxID=3154557 RepID=UPI0033BF6EFE
MSFEYLPLKSGTYTVSSPFGPRDGGFHYGMDFAAKMRTPFYAPLSGTIVEGAERTDVEGFGRWVWLDAQAAAGVDLIFGHGDPAVRGGDRVRAGQLLGYVNTYGQSTGPHLHLEVWTPPGRVGGRAVDPAPYFAGAVDPTSSQSPSRSPSMASKPDYVELDRMGNSCSNRWGSRVRNILWHTEEGNSSAESLAAYLNNTGNEVSYHYTIRDGVVVDVVDTDYASWSVLDANPYTINMCFAGSRSSWSRDQWLAREADIRIAAWLSVQDARKYNTSTDMIPPPYTRRDGISDHKYVTQCLGIGTHTDLGYAFPWDVAAKHVAEFVSGATPAPVAPAVNMIDQEAARAAAWIGKRQTEGELPTSDGEGRYAEFDNGYVYWHPRVGAHALPLNVFQKWAELGWEAGSLGYPVGDHTVLKAADGSAVGDVQGFENGAIYRRYGQPGAWVHGEIRNRWNRSGFETGPFGWPTSDEVPFDTGSYQEFEHGRIYWTPKQTLGLLTSGETDTPVADAA